MRRALILGLSLIALHARADDPVPFEPTDRYEPRRVEGWPILVSKRLIANDPTLAAETSKLLESQLYQIARVVPEGPLKALRKVTIWVERDEPHHPCMAYHPDAGWLRDHGMNPGKARCVEIANARNFLSWTKEQPWMVLHELAHAYHHQVLAGGFDNAEVKAAFEAAMKAGLYDKVLVFDGVERRAYAATDPMEYFAEASEAFLGSNDFYPFVRAELRLHDPEMNRLLCKLWSVP